MLSTTTTETLRKSESVRAASVTSRREAGALLWEGSKAAIQEWDTNKDSAGEFLYEEVKAALGGKHRKGDAAKVKKVALAKRDYGLVLVEWANLSQAYREACRLTDVMAREAAEDKAADAAVADAAKREVEPGSIEDAANRLVGAGLPQAVSAILDALGKENIPAHKALLRALTDEVGKRQAAAEKIDPAKPKTAKPAKPKGDVQVAKPAAAKPAAAKPKPAAAKPKPAAAKPAAAKPKPKPKPAAAKPKPAAAKPKA